MLWNFLHCDKNSISIKKAKKLLYFILIVFISKKYLLTFFVTNTKLRLQYRYT